jgi:hypothetical protein
MSSRIHSPLIRAALFAFLALDLLGAVAFLYDQLFSVEAPYLWVLSTVLVLVASPLLLRATDVVLGWAEEEAGVPNAEEKIP